MKKFWPAGLGRHLVRHPHDALAVVSAAWLLRRTGWWRTPPFVPVPSDAYWAFRMSTAYGEQDAQPNVHDVVAAARWSRGQRRRR